MAVRSVGAWISCRILACLIQGVGKFQSWSLHSFLNLPMFPKEQPYCVLTGVFLTQPFRKNPLCNGYCLSLTGFHKDLFVWTFRQTYFNLNSFTMFKNSLTLQLMKECVLTKSTFLVTLLNIYFYHIYEVFKEFNVH